MVLVLLGEDLREEGGSSVKEGQGKFSSCQLRLTRAKRRPF